MKPVTEVVQTTSQWLSVVILQTAAWH